MIEETAGNEMATSGHSGNKSTRATTDDSQPVSTRTRRKPKVE